MRNGQLGFLLTRLGRAGERSSNTAVISRGPIDLLSLSLYTHTTHTHTRMFLKTIYLALLMGLIGYQLEAQLLEADKLFKVTWRRTALGARDRIPGWLDGQTSFVAASLMFYDCTVHDKCPCHLLLLVLSNNYMKLALEYLYSLAVMLL